MNLPEFEEEKCMYSRGTTEPHWDVDTAKLKLYYLYFSYQPLALG